MNCLQTCKTQFIPRYFAKNFSLPQDVETDLLMESQSCAISFKILLSSTSVQRLPVCRRDAFPCASLNWQGAVNCFDGTNSVGAQCLGMANLQLWT